MGQAGPANASHPAQATSTSASSSARAWHAAPVLTLEQQIARLPPLTGINIDVKAQGPAILQHLSEILRFYRSATTTIQKAAEPSDILYAQQSKAQAAQIAQFAFQSARNEAALLTRVNAPANATPDAQETTGQPPESQRIAAVRARIVSQISALQAVDAANDAAIAHSNAKTRPPLLQKQEQIDGEFKLLQATLDALNRIARFTDSEGGHTGVRGEIERLADSAPELSSGTGKSITAPPLENIRDAQHAGVVTQASALFDLLSARRSIDEQIADTNRLRNQAENLRGPFTRVLGNLIKQGQILSQQTVNLQATPTTDAQDVLATRKQFDQLTSTFRVLADAMLPLTQEVTVLEEERGTLTSWRTAVQSEYIALLRSILIRVALIAVALLVLVVVGQIWNRATLRYVSDLRRRRQLLLVRRIVVGFLGGLVMLFGFVTQFSSLATFAGFLTAGIAVGLQTILLSVAAYFFIVGRYGVRVGDRITVAGVTGTVIEVGIARFYMMELVGSGTELHSTGRVAVFANSVLFQTGTPLYKQLPGTEYAWHELIAKLKPEADIDAATKALIDVVDSVYQPYRQNIEAQQHQIETWMGTALDTPRIDAHLRMGDDGPQVAVLFPVEIDSAAKTDEAIASKLVQQMRTDGPLKSNLAATPVIKAAIKT
ncbi:MAG TPA: mechanosensitive ion channel protein MscS [Acidobacteriaceae bacterium]